MEKFEIFEKFINGEPLEDISPVVEYLKSTIITNPEFYAYLRSKHPYKIVRQAKIWGHRDFVLVEWMGKYYPCWTTGHSSLKGIAALKGFFEIEHGGQVYSASGEGQYWHYKEFDGCVTLEDFTKTLAELEGKTPYFEVFELSGSVSEGDAADTLPQEDSHPQTLF